MAQAKLDAERTAAERNELGQFATPPALARQIIQALLQLRDPAQPIRFIEPSVGSGAFVSALLHEVPHNEIASMIGMELDPRFASSARDIWGAHGLTVIQGDFTTTAPGQDPDQRGNLIAANPPYVRHHHLKAEAKLRLKGDVARLHAIALSGLSGLYVSYLMLSTAWMQPGAVGAWLIPTEWMDVNYGSALRRFFCERVELLRVHLFDAADVQFGDALVSSCVVFFRNAAANAGATIGVTHGAIDTPEEIATHLVSSLCSLNKWSSFLRMPAGQHVVHRGITVGDLFRIRRGIATGSNAFFIRTRGQWAELGVPESFLRPVLPAGRYLRTRVVESGDDGYPALDESVALLDCDLEWEVIQAQHPALEAYLSSMQAQQASESYLARHRYPWYTQEQRAPSRFVATYMGRGRPGESPFRVFVNRSNAIATNVLNMLYPLGPLEAALAAHPNTDVQVATLLERIAQDHFQSHGRVYGGGLHKLEPKELASLPAERIVELLHLPIAAGTQTLLRL